MWTAKCNARQHVLLQSYQKRESQGAQKRLNIMGEEGLVFVCCVDVADILLTFSFACRIPMVHDWIVAVDGRTDTWI